MVTCKQWLLKMGRSLLNTCVNVKPIGYVGSKHTMKFALW